MNSIRAKVRVLSFIVLLLVKQINNIAIIYINKIIENSINLNVKCYQK